ncbi:hypothetical protein DB41_JI00010 [Neochlamydia sp. TUME1]|nr:hypothetical protein DB41_JI00010 [Neochlamydia sp. TUME1]
MQVINFKKGNISLYIHAVNGINSDQTAPTSLIAKHPTKKFALGKREPLYSSRQCSLYPDTFYISLKESTELICHAYAHANYYNIFKANVYWVF